MPAAAVDRGDIADCRENGLGAKLRRSQKMRELNTRSAHSKSPAVSSPADEAPLTPSVARERLAVAEDVLEVCAGCA